MCYYRAPIVAIVDLFIVEELREEVEAQLRLDLAIETYSQSLLVEADEESLVDLKPFKRIQSNS